MKVSTIKQLRSVLRDYRGLEVHEIKSVNSDGIAIHFSCPYKTVLFLILIIMDDVNFQINTLPGKYLVSHILVIEKRLVKRFCRLLKERLDEESDVLQEDFKEINNFLELNEISKKKYVNYVKYLRNSYDSGEALTAVELLELERFCPNCDKELYTIQDQNQAILEFDGPEGIHEKLNQTVCEREDENDNYEETVE